jgi:COX assembly protein 2
MHPPLAPHLHTKECREVIEQLSRCHSEHPVAKFFGSCNSLKRALDKCLTDEYRTRRRANQERGEKKQQEWKKLYEDGK